MKRFALIGAAGYVAPRHMKAIKETGHILIAALDPHDSVGILDRYFPDTHFFTEFERFDRHLEKLKRKGEGIDYLVVCSPNYLHDAHIRFGLRLGANVICEKPLVLNPWNVTALQEIEREHPGKVYNILQLRLHPSVIALKQKIEAGPADKVYDLDLTYFTSRGNWYHRSWKGDQSKSGGIATNIGIHFFDMLLWIFGAVKTIVVKEHGTKNASGTLHLEKANVKWVLSVDSKQISSRSKTTDIRTHRSLKIEGEEFDFSQGFADLHTESYREILSGNGYYIEAIRPAIDVVYAIRNWKG